MSPDFVQATGGQSLRPHKTQVKRGRLLRLVVPKRLDAEIGDDCLTAENSEEYAQIQIPTLGQHRHQT
ncbi:Uncharacterised protein [Vibrio cholerae]|nr:Uncharacterised protein [Vibrio cholerae]CSC61497.1 Uncharacterised protein [Vibrio cholerae]